MKKVLFLLIGLAAVFVFIQINQPSLVKNNKSIDTSNTLVTETINRPIIGIHYRMIDKQTAIQNSLVEGAYITKVIEGSLAQKANLKEEDIITEIDSRLIAGLESQSVYDLISTLKPGSKVDLKIWRNKEIKNIFITLE